MLSDRLRTTYGGCTSVKVGNLGISFLSHSSRATIRVICHVTRVATQCGLALSLRNVCGPANVGHACPRVVGFRDIFNVRRIG